MAYYTPISSGAAANAATINAPLTQLDAQLLVASARADAAATYAISATSELSAARNPYATLKARLDDMMGGYTGGNIATLTDGAASAGQKIVTVDSTEGFLADAYVSYALADGTVENNLIATVDTATQLTLTTNIGSGGIANNTYIGMISVSEYQAANTIPHAGSLTLPQTIQIINRRRHNAEAYGLSEAASATVNTAALIAAITAAESETPNGVVEVGPGIFEINGPVDCKNVRITGAAGTPGPSTLFRATHASATLIISSGGCLSDLCFDGNDVATIGITINGVSEFQLRNIYVINCATGIEITDTSTGSGIGTFDGLVTSACIVPVKMNCSIGSSFWFRACNFWDSTSVFKFTGAGGSSLIIRDCWFEKFLTAFDASTSTSGIGFTNLVIDSNHFISTLPEDAGVYTCRIFKSVLTADVGVVFTNIVFSDNYLFLTKAAYIAEIDWGAYIGSGANRFYAEFANNHFAWSGSTNLVAWLKSDCASWGFVKVGWQNNTDSGNAIPVQDGTQPMNRQATFGAADATPSVASRDEIYYSYNSGGATTITTFDNGYAGQRFIVVFADANTTIDFSGTNLKGNSGVDWTASVGDWMEAFFDGTNWYCSVHDCTA